ncbi:MAG: ABC transporter permease [Planctomycetaceae bacterium]|nr:ABC transporter permease [Planctomycetaceae bacterium]
MSIWLIAWKSIRQRGLASGLTALSMAIGVALVVMVLTIYGVVAENFKSGSSLGYNMIIGARGGPLQLVLNTVFYLSKPVQTIPYEYYLAFEDASQREQEMRHSFSYQSQVARNQTKQMLHQLSSGMPGMGSLGLLDEVASAAENDFAIQQMRILDDGIFSLYAKMAIPICMGDTYGETSQYRVVATTPAFFNELELDVDTGRKFEFAQGRAFETWNSTNGVLEAVVGSAVAANEGLKLGDPIQPIHGDIGAGGHIHRTEFIVVGIMAPSGTRNDSAVFINIEGFYMMDEHRKPLEDERVNSQRFASGADDDLDEQAFQDRLDQELEQRLAAEAAKSEFAEPVPGAKATPNAEPDNKSAPLALPNKAGSDGSLEPSAVAAADQSPSRSIYGTPLPIEQRELTAILLRSHDEVGVSLFGIANAVNLGQLENEMDWTAFSPRLQQRSAQSVTPVAEIQSVFETFVTPIQWLILAMTVMICVVSGIGILVSIYNSMSERRQEIAVMRALGADQSTVLGIILAESVLLSAGGGFLGWVVAHGVNGIISPWVQQRTGVALSVWDFAPGLRFEWGWIDFNLSSELMLVPGLVVLAILVGLLPAVSAYRLDVSENLS